MKKHKIKNYISKLRARVQYLEEINRLTLDALDIAASLGDFQKSINNLADRSAILKESRGRVLKLLPFRATAFFLVNELNSQFYLADCKPDKFDTFIKNEVDILIENGTFAWALREKRPVIISTSDFESRLILHLMTTTSRTRGMFVGLLTGDEKDIPHISLSLLTIVLLNSANALESFELYSMIKQININLEKIVAERTEELTYRVEFENLIATLSTTFINLAADQIDSGIENALQTIGKFIHADCGFVLILEKDGTLSRQCYQWKEEGINFGIGEIGGTRFEDYPLLAQCIEKTENLYIPSVADLPEESKKGRLLPWDNTRALILVPIVSGNTPIGVLGFHSVKGVESWSDGWAAQIKIVGDMLVNALERKWSEQERKKLENQLEHSHRMKGIGTLAAGVAHELNQPLMVIRTFVQMLLRKFDENAVYYEELKMMEKNTGRMKKIIDHLRDFSRQTPSEIKPVDINAMIEDAFLLVGEQLRRANIEVEKHLASGLPGVMGSVNQLEQVLVNLITNAMDAIGDKRGTASQDAGNGDKSNSDGKLKIITRLSNDSKNHVEVLVIDNGSGMPKEIASRIFDPFFTTKDVGKGTGLGLSISYGIVKEHRGDIEILETGPTGSILCMKLPATPSATYFSN